MTARPQSAGPQPPLRASRRSFKRSAGKRFRKPVARVCRVRAIERKLGIHRATIKKYMDTEGPPTRQSWAVATTPSSDTIQA